MKSFVFENKNFRLTVGENAITESLIYKPNGEELLYAGEDISLFSVTQLRPFNNEVKLAYMNKRTTFEANKISVDGNNIIVDFEIIPYQAVVTFDVKDEYISFTLTDFIVPYDLYDGLSMDLPPVEEFRILQLPIKNRKNFGQWINAVWDEKASACVLAAMPEAIIDSERRVGYRILTADAQKCVNLKGTTASLIVSGGREEFLGAVNTLEHDFGLPLGVESRKNPIINRSIYWSADLCPANVDEHLKYAKMGGFDCMLLYYECMCPLPKTWSYGTCGDYSISEKYPGGYEDMKAVIKKIKDAGITPGIHFLHTHIGKYTKYITPVCDHRLNLLEHYTIAKPLGLGNEDIYVYENPKNAQMFEDKRVFNEENVVLMSRKVLQFGGELIKYEGFTTEPPYRFYGIERGYWNTNIVEHPVGQIGGLLDVSEYVATSAYIDQNTDLQDEIAEEIAKLYDCGFEFIYFDGSEGTNVPYEYHVPNAQYRVIKKLGSSPLFCEGAAKAHFGWHHLSGANAFDVFKTDVFKEMLDKHPLAEAPHMAQDFTRLNFGWWAFYNDTRRDVYEYGTSRAFGWDCPITIQTTLERFGAHARIKDIMEVMRRWEYARKNNILTKEEKDMLKIGGTEHTLLINEEGEYELVPYFEVKGAFSGAENLWAFVFERRGKSYALVWHNTGSAKVKIDLADAKYERDLGKELLTVEKSGDSIVIELSDSAYLSADISLEEMKNKIAEATLI